MIIDDDHSSLGDRGHTGDVSVVAEHVDVGLDAFYVCRLGSGPPVMVLHGGPGMDHSYMRGFDQLADLVHLAYLDHRGDGRSTGNGLAAMTMGSYAEDADGVRVALGLDQVAILGHSHGGSVALEFALHYPDSVSALILIAAVGSYDYEMTPPDDVAARATTEQREVLSRPVVTDDDLRDNFMARAHRTVASPANAARVLSAYENLRCSVEANKAGWVAGEGWNVLGAVGSVTCPVLLVVGASDWITPPTEVERLADGLPSSQMIVIPKAGHFPWIEQPELVFSAIREFLQATIVGSR